MLLNKGTKGTKAKNLGKRVHYFNQFFQRSSEKRHQKTSPQVISKKILGDLKRDFRRDLIRLSSKRSPQVIFKEISPGVNTHDRM